MIIWNERFSTGVEALDQQHCVLIDQINRLEKMVNSTNPTLEDVKFITQLVDYLQNYAETHFRHEENCMERFNCPAHAQNQQAHQKFRDFFDAYIQQSKQEGFQLDLIRKLHQTASAWITEHILRVDTCLRPCVTNQPVTPPR